MAENDLTKIIGLEKNLRAIGDASKLTDDQSGELVNALIAINDEVNKEKLGVRVLTSALSALNKMRNISDKDIRRMVLTRKIENAAIEVAINKKGKLSKAQLEAVGPKYEKYIKSIGLVTEAELKVAQTNEQLSKKIIESLKGRVGAEEEYNVAILANKKASEDLVKVQEDQEMQQAHMGKFLVLQWKKNFKNIGDQSKGAAGAVPLIGGVLEKLMESITPLKYLGATIAAFQLITTGAAKSMEGLPFLRFVGMSGDPSVALQARNQFLMKTASLFMSNQEAMSLMEATYKQHALTTIPLTKRLTMSNEELDQAMKDVSTRAASTIVDVVKLGKGMGLDVAGSVKLASIMMGQLNVKSEDTQKSLTNLYNTSRLLGVDVMWLAEQYGGLNDKLKFTGTTYGDINLEVLRLMGSMAALGNSGDKLWDNITKRPQMMQQILGDLMTTLNQIPAMTYIAFDKSGRHLAPGELIYKAMGMTPLKKGLTVIGGFMDSIEGTTKSVKDLIGLTAQAFPQFEQMGAEGLKMLEVIRSATETIEAGAYAGMTEQQVIAEIAKSSGKSVEEIERLGTGILQAQKGPMGAIQAGIDRIVALLQSIAGSFLLGGFGGGKDAMWKNELKNMVSGETTSVISPQGLVAKK